MMVVPGAADKQFHLPRKPERGMINGLLIIPPWSICRVDGAAPGGMGAAGRFPGLLKLKSILGA
jgi:hypothetical protein